MGSDIAGPIFKFWTKKMCTQSNLAIAAMTAAIALTCVSSTSAAGESEIRLSTGIEISSGDFGGDVDIEDLYVPVSARMDVGRVGLRLTVPYLRVSAPSETTEIGEDGQPVAGLGPIKTESGVGDVIVGITLYDVINDPYRGLLLDITGKVKIGTADHEKLLGTGENDYSVAADLYKFYEHFVLMGSVGYKWRGDPAGVDLDNVAFGTVGAAFDVASDTQLGIYYDFRQSALAANDASHEITGLVSRDMFGDWQMQVYAYAGLSDSSPDWGGGLSLATSFGGIAPRQDR